MSGRERVAACSFAASVVASIVLAAVYWRGGQTQAEGVCLFVVTGGIGFGIVQWAKAAMPDEMYRVFMHYKRDEWEKFMATVTDWDTETYLDYLP